MRWYGHILRMNGDRIPKKVLNMKVYGKCRRGRLKSRQEPQVKKDVTKKEDHGQKLMSSCGKTDKWR
jgi:hypothetical protein